MATAAQHTVTVRFSKETSEALVQYISDAGDTGSEAISHFVEEAVQDRIFREAARRAKEANANRSEEEILHAVDEALDAVRRTQ